MSAEQIKKHSEIRKGHPVSEETKEKLRKHNTGKKHSETTRLRMSQDRSGNSNHFYGKTHSVETKEKMKSARAKQVFSEETRAKKSLKMKEYWSQRKGLNVV